MASLFEIIVSKIISLVLFFFISCFFSSGVFFDLIVFIFELLVFDFIIVHVIVCILVSFSVGSSFCISLIKTTKSTAELNCFFSIFSKNESIFSFFHHAFLNILINFTLQSFILSSSDLINNLL
jgi:hypothetical protein